MIFIQKEVNFQLTSAQQIAQRVRAYFVNFSTRINNNTQTRTPSDPILKIVHQTETLDAMKSVNE